MPFRLSTVLVLALALGCNDPKPRSEPAGALAEDTGWVRLPSSREPDCTDPTWICATWKDQEWQRTSLYGTGAVAFVTVRATDASFTQRLQVSCPTATYRIVWASSSAVFDTLSMPAWIPMTDRWERGLWSGVCTQAGLVGRN